MVVVDDDADADAADIEPVEGPVRVPAVVEEGREGGWVEDIGLDGMVGGFVGVGGLGESGKGISAAVMEGVDACRWVLSFVRRKSNGAKQISITNQTWQTKQTEQIKQTNEHHPLIKGVLRVG